MDTTDAPPTAVLRRKAARPVAAEARPDRRQAILLTAERLFAQRGYDGVSIRQIAEAAGVPLALVGYYFGPKQALFRAIFESWSHTIEARLALLRATDAEPWRADKLERIVQAFIEPVIRMRASAEGEFYALLITRGLANPSDEADLIVRDFFDPMAEAFIDVLQRTLAEEAPGVSRATVAWCYQFALGALMHHITDQRVERLSHGQAQPHDPAAAAQLLRFVVGGIRACVAMA